MNYDRFIKTAQRLIAKFGQTVTWRKVNPTAGASPWEYTVGTTDFPTLMVFVTSKGELKQFLEFMKGTNVVVGGVTALMGAVTGFSPADTDVVVRDGLTLAIESIDIVNPAGAPILYKVNFKA